MTYFQLSSLSALVVTENRTSASPGRLAPKIRGIFYRGSKICPYKSEHGSTNGRLSRQQNANRYAKPKMFNLAYLPRSLLESFNNLQH